MSASENSRVLVYGAGWCHDTARTRRLLRRMGVPHVYRDVDLDLEALRDALALHDGQRRTPIVELGDEVLAEPSNAELLEALVRHGHIARSTARARLKDHNVGDLDRALRLAAALSAVAATSHSPAVVRWPVRLGAAVLVLTAVRAWCPIYDTCDVTSVDGPGDRPDGAERRAWLAPVGQSLEWSES